MASAAEPPLPQSNKGLLFCRTLTRSFMAELIGPSRSVFAASVSALDASAKYLVIVKGLFRSEIFLKPYRIFTYRTYKTCTEVIPLFNNKLLSALNKFDPLLLHRGKEPKSNITD